MSLVPFRLAIMALACAMFCGSDLALAQTSGMVPGITDQDAIPVLQLKPADARKVIALSGHISNGVLELSNVEVQSGFAPEDFGGTDRVHVELLGPDGRVVKVESFIDPRRVEELDGGDVEQPSEVEFDVTIPYRSRTTDLRINLPSDLRPGPDRRLLNGVELSQMAGPPSAVRVDLKSALVEFCKGQSADPDCRAVPLGTP